MTDIKKLIKESFGKVEKYEASKATFVESEYPEALRRHFLIYESFGMSLEETYFWIKDTFTDLGFPIHEKIVDTLTASEQSALFGSSQQRLGIQQDRVSSYLATIGKMVKEMFQIVREIKLLEEREVLYINAAGYKNKGPDDKKPDRKPDDGAEKALKGIWIDFIDNGPQGLKASSVYGLASQLGYQALPDLFFASPPALTQEGISKHVDSLKNDYNERVRTVLVRKLEQYVAWRDATFKEITSKKKFTLNYLRQHYNSIMLYMDWVRPYLRNVRRMAQNPNQQASADIVGAFEGSVIEVELLAKKPAKDAETPRSCILATFLFRTRPIMQTGQDFQRGPLHVGRVEVSFRGYAWSDKDIAKYKAIREAEDFDMLKSIDTSIEKSMEFLGDDLKKYLLKEGEKFGKDEDVELLAKSLLESKLAATEDDAREQAKKMIEKKKEEKGPSPFEPFLSIFSGFKEIAKSFSSGDKKPSEAEMEKKKKIDDARKGSIKGTKMMTTMVYTLYKKSHRLVTP